MSDGRPVPGSLYFYAPNKGAAAFATVAFAASGLFHLWQCIHLKAFKIIALIPFTCLLFTAGFALREYNAFQYSQPQIFIASMTLIYMSPPILELANYHIFGRMLYYVPYCATLHPGRTFITFGALSSVVEMLNGVGVAWIVNQKVPPKISNVGESLLKVSLIIQILVIFIFLLFTGAFQYRCHKVGISVRSVNGPCVTMYISSLLILIRCVYRTVEHFSTSNLRFGGVDSPTDINPVVRYEWYFYAFEVVPMIINCVLWNIRHPRYYLPENYHMYLAQDGVTELVGPGWKDNRAFVVTAIDPCGLCGTGKGGPKPFWESNGYANRTAPA